jgi:predicted RNA binding protein YcfA (HicA-like mRNA interferase family)
LVKLRLLSGKEVCAILRKAGFEEVRRRGSHIVMQKKIPQGTITVPVPDHNEIRIGTLQSTFASPASRVVSLSLIKSAGQMTAASPGVWKFVFRYPCLKNFFHNCLITNDLKAAKASLSPLKRLLREKLA